MASCPHNLSKRGALSDKVLVFLGLDICGFKIDIRHLWLCYYITLKEYISNLTREAPFQTSCLSSWEGFDICGFEIDIRHLWLCNYITL